MRTDGLTIDHPTQEVTKERPVIRHPLIRLLLFVLLFLACNAVALIPAMPFLEKLSETGEASVSVGTAIIAVLVAYFVLVRYIERRQPTELTGKILSGTLVGLHAGLALISAVVGIVWLLNGIEFTGTQTPTGWAMVLIVTGFQAGIIEEIITRGVLFRLIEELLGSWGSTALSAFIFGALHLGNDNATFASAMSIAVSAGLLFAALYMLTRSLWVCIGTHFAWNVAQALLFDIAVSGNDHSGFFASHPVGNDLISGGAFGVEASIVTPIVVGLVAVALFVRAAQIGNVVAPKWMRAKA